MDAVEVHADVHSLALLFKALADENRLRILRLIGPGAPPAGLCVMALAQALGISQPAVSQHLAVLRAVGLIVPRRQGYFLHCRLNRSRIEECRRLMAEFFGLDLPIAMGAEASAEPESDTGIRCGPAAEAAPADCGWTGHRRSPHCRRRRRWIIEGGENDA